MLRISPAGEFLLQRCKRNQKTAGGGLRAFDNALSRLPRTPISSTGEPSRGGVSPSGAGKGQDTVPRAARCRSTFFEQVLASTRAVAPASLPSRGRFGGRSAPTGAANGSNCGPETNGRIISAPTQKRKTARNGRPQAAPTQKRKSPKARKAVPFPHSLPYGRRGEAKLRRKFFAKLSFKKAGVGWNFSDFVLYYLLQFFRKPHFPT